MKIYILLSVLFALIHLKSANPTKEPDYEEKKDVRFKFGYFSDDLTKFESKFIEAILIYTYLT
jgi:hypothetical protein